MSWSSPEESIEYISVGFGWYIYIKFNKNEVKWVKANLGPYYAGAAAVAAKVCVAIPVVIGSAACAGAVAFYAYLVWNTFTAAAKYKQCVQLGFSYSIFPTLGPVTRYNC